MHYVIQRRHHTPAQVELLVVVTISGLSIVRVKCVGPDILASQNTHDSCVMQPDARLSTSNQRSLPQARRTPQYRQTFVSRACVISHPVCDTASAEGIAAVAPKVPEGSVLARCFTGCRASIIWLSIRLILAVLVMIRAVLAVPTTPDLRGVACLQSQRRECR